MTSVEQLRDPSIALCFDTSVIGPRAGLNPRPFFDAIRRRGPNRPLIVPAIVVAESVRQLHQRFGDQYNPRLIQGFIDDPNIKLDVASFDRHTAEIHWLHCVHRFTEEDWRRVQRARFADHAVYAVTRSVGAILITADDALQLQLSADNYQPGWATKEELQRALADDGAR